MAMRTGRLYADIRLKRWTLPVIYMAVLLGFCPPKWTFHVTMRVADE